MIKKINIADNVGFKLDNFNKNAKNFFQIFYLNFSPYFITVLKLP
jgi:hypothetical protein